MNTGERVGRDDVQAARVRREIGAGLNVGKCARRGGVWAKSVWMCVDGETRR